MAQLTANSTVGGKVIAKKEELTSHQAETMPHQFVDATDKKAYRYGFKTNPAKDGLMFVYEEVL